MTHIYIEKVQTEFLEDAYQSMNKKPPWENVIIVHMVDIMPVIDPHKRYYNQVFIGLPSLKIPEILFYIVMSVKGLAILVGAMRCIKIILL